MKIPSPRSESGPEGSKMAQTKVQSAIRILNNCLFHCFHPVPFYFCLYNTSVVYTAQSYPVVSYQKSRKNNNLSPSIDLFPRLAPILNSARSVWAADRPHSVHPVKRTHPACFKLHAYIHPIQEEEVARNPCTMHLKWSRQI